MNKKFLVFLSIVGLLFSVFALSIMAEDNVPAVTDTYYLVASNESQAFSELTAKGVKVVCYGDIICDTTGANGNGFFGNFPDNSHIEIIFGEDIFVSSEVAANNIGILINKKITVTFKYNGFSHFINSGTYLNENNETVECSGNGIVVRHKEALVRIIGTSGQDMENGGVSKIFNVPTVNAIDGSWNVDGCNLDAYKTNNNYLKIYKGNAYVENVRAFAPLAFILSDSEAAGVYEIVSSAISSTSDYATQFKGTNSKTVKIENSYTKGLEAWSVISGSYVKSSTIEGVGVVIDSWHDPGKIWEFTDCEILGEKIHTSTGRTYLWFIDCTFRDGIRWNLNGDNGGNQYSRIYVSPTCTEPGSLEMKQSYNKGSSNPFAEEVANYSAPALGHTGTAEWAFDYEGDKYLSKLTATKGCARCGLWEPQEVKIGAMFQPLGYSVSLYHSNPSITLGFTMNKDAIGKYEELSGNTLNFGFAVAMKDLLGENVAPLDKNGNAVVLEKGSVVKANITSSALFCISIKVKLTQELSDKLLLMTGYVAERNGDELSISYMQSGDKLIQNDEFKYVSCNNQ